MQLTVRNIAAEDTWKDIVRIKKKFRQRVSNSSDGPPQVAAALTTGSLAIQKQKPMRATTCVKGTESDIPFSRVTSHLA